MKFKQVCSRTEPPGGGASLEELISPDNEVRLIDAFVNSLPLQKLGFRTDFPENGRPAYHPTILLKLLVYGYLNRIRSSRCLERECGRNIEVMWLLGQLKPDHNTIANFRKNNAKAICKLPQILGHCKVGFSGGAQGGQLNIYSTFKWPAFREAYKELI